MINKHLYNQHLCNIMHIRLHAIMQAYNSSYLIDREYLRELDFWTAMQLWTDSKHKLLNLFWKGGVTTCATPTEV